MVPPAVARIARLLATMGAIACLVATADSAVGTGTAAAPQVGGRTQTPIVFKAQPEDREAIVAWLNALERGQDVAIQFQPRNAFQDAFDKEATAWLKAPNADREHRKRVLAVAILHGGYYAVASDTWRNVRWLIEWECDQLRRGPVSEFEHVWLQASIVLIQAAGDRIFLEPPSKSGALDCDRLDPCDHAWHALSRFHDDPQFRLAHTVPWLRTKPFERRPGAMLDSPRLHQPEFAQRLQEIFAGLRAFADDPVVGPEIRLKLGLLHYALNETADSLREMRAAGRSRDPYVRYVAAFVTGLVHEAEGQPDVAIHDYEAALAAMPNVRSGATWLAAKYFLAGRRDEAFRLMDEVYAAPAPPIDPWHHSDELRHWPDYFARLRELIRK
jgi:tetratricopeptide (TPR) repeat protein